MLKRIYKIIIFLSPVLLLCSCKTAMIPASYRFNPVNVQREITGSWIDVNFRLIRGSTTDQTISGELIAIQNDSIYVLTSVALTGISTINLNEAKLYVFNDRTGAFATITALTLIPNIVGAIFNSMGGFLAIGVPWLLAGTSLTITEGIKTSSHLIYSYRNNLDELRNFARFPMGIPSGIDKIKLHLLVRGNP